jgi:hypothetical protein
MMPGAGCPNDERDSQVPERRGWRDVSTHRRDRSIVAHREIVRVRHDGARIVV